MRYRKKKKRPKSGPVAFFVYVPRWRMLLVMVAQLRSEIILKAKQHFVGSSNIVKKLNINQQWVQDHLKADCEKGFSASLDTLIETRRSTRSDLHLRNSAKT